MTPAGERAFHARASALFIELRALDPATRDARLARVEDPVLREEVVSLLAHDLPSTDESEHAPHAAAGEEAGPFEPGAMLGVYKIVRRLGRGATGVVLLGEQTEPVRRRVAIKLVPHAMLDAGHAARLEFERFALERADHPGVPKVLDAGRTPAGMPYIVMEFVDGVPVSTYCQTHRVSVPDRVALIIEVASAVQHAHQRGVIHRDLKPSNILVASGDRGPQPKIVDFGIARALDREGADSLTQGLPIGTLAYMPPEQAGEGEVDTRSDVYALGAVLYELVVGRPPIRFDGIDAIDAVRTREPTPLGRPPAGCGLSRSAWSDLGRVLGCALEKTPSRRYPTADAFAQDLRRVLGREPVVAHAQTPMYRLVKLVERRKVASLAVVLAAAALGVGIAGISVGYAEASRQRALADQRSDALEAMNRFLVDDLLAGISPEEIAADTPAVVLLDRASTRIDLRFAARPLLASELHHTLGRSYTSLSVFDRAEDSLERAATLATDAAGADSPHALRARLSLASLLAYRQRFDDANNAFARVLPIAERVLHADDPALHAAWNDAGVSLESSGRASDGVELLGRALEARRRTLGDDDPMVLQTLSNLAQALDAQGDADASLAMLLEAATIAGRTPDASPLLMLGLHNNIGATYLDLGRDTEASAHLEQAWTLASDWFGADDPATLTILSNLASLRARLGDASGAARAFERIVDARTALMGPDVYDTLIARHGLWSATLAKGEAARAEAGFTALRTDCERSLGASHWLTGAVMVSHAASLRSLGRLTEAREAAARGRAVLGLALGADHPRTAAADAILSELSADPDRPAAP